MVCQHAENTEAIEPLFVSNECACMTTDLAILGVSTSLDLVLKVQDGQSPLYPICLLTCRKFYRSLYRKPIPSVSKLTLSLEIFKNI